MTTLSDLENEIGRSADFIVAAAPFPCVYGVFADDRLVYVGKGGGFRRPLSKAHHAVTEMHRVAIWRCDTDAEACLLEASLIRRFQPLLNKLIPPVDSRPSDKNPPASYRLSSEALCILKELAFEQGVTMTAIVESIIRREAKKEGLAQ